MFRCGRARASRAAGRRIDQPVRDRVPATIRRISSGCGEHSDPCPGRCRSVRRADDARLRRAGRRGNQPDHCGRATWHRRGRLVARLPGGRRRVGGQSDRLVVGSRLPQLARGRDPRLPRAPHRVGGRRVRIRPSANGRGPRVDPGGTRDRSLDRSCAGPGSATRARAGAALPSGRGGHRPRRPRSLGRQ